ncbi:hypothetical protein ISN45_Aa07g028450 [Arabidopsis thaliana x Arabidopsis arenosa]|uniref:Uncharacterized protein n=1 Tax=Arabidopsis thaliana x Arabidopsis arenosa TaxID=1240361 RepID=A0A8T1Y6Z7_9BRAS|nr:hypothetical protein ISN45_Aa07g028450 [Arabidopsis thaliana x Arabidopsis arenosa]
MFSYMNSKWKLMLEEQERGIAWSPTSYHGPNEASSSNEYQPDVYYAQDNQHGYEYQPDVYYAQDNQHGYEYQPDVYYAQENQCGYGEEYQSCNMEYDYTCYQGPYESSTSREYQHDGYDERYQSRQQFNQGNFQSGPQPYYQNQGQGSSSKPPIQEADTSALLQRLVNQMEEQKREKMELATQLKDMQDKFEHLSTQVNGQASSSKRPIGFLPGDWTPGSRVVEPTNVESIDTELTQWIEEEEEEEEECIPPSEEKTNKVLFSDIEDVFKENAQIKDEFLQEAKESIRKFELLLECTVDENLVVRYEEPTKEFEFLRGCMVDEMDALADEILEEITLEDLHQSSLMVNQEEFGVLANVIEVEEVTNNDDASNGKTSIDKNWSELKASKVYLKPLPKELRYEFLGTIFTYPLKINPEIVCVVGKPLDDPCDGVLVVVGKPLDDPCDDVLDVEYMVENHDLGVISTNELSIFEPRKILFEEIRMNIFRGWFYDEYDPGDTLLPMRVT